MVRNILIEIEYDGTNYCGWQIQPNGRTIQEELMKALEKLTGKHIKINGSGRTDAGVHARGQAASFYFESSIPIDRIPIAMNTYLPRDISVLNACEVPMDFHARYSAEGKRYSYHIYHHRQRSALLYNYSYHVPYDLDLTNMIKASDILKGTHDFKGFMASGSSVKDTVRTIYDIEIHRNGNSIWITVEGNGFLYNMVRIMVGTLIEVAMGKIQAGIVKDVLDSRDRNLAGHTAPPQGLYLDKVFYPLTR